MKKKIVVLLLSFSIVSSMLLAGCGNNGTDSAGSTTETEAAAQDDTSEQNEEAAPDENPAEETETPDVMLTGDTEITDQDVQELYNSIKESVTTEYLEPNEIDPADFSWPSSDSDSWNYVNDLYTACYLCIDLGTPFTEEETAQYKEQYPEQDTELFDAVFSGIIKWMDSRGDYDSAYFSKVMGTLNPYNSVLPTITF